LFPSHPIPSGGIASLFTREFYERLTDGSHRRPVFAVGAGYQIDIRTMKTVYATLRSVFPFIKTWQTSDGDYLLICSRNA